VQNVEKEERNN